MGTRTSAVPSIPVAGPGILRRRQFVMHWADPFRMGAGSLIAVLLIVVVMNAIAWHSGIEQLRLARVSAPELVPAIAAHEAERRVWGLVLSLGVLFLFAVLRVLEVHRTQGAAFRIVQDLERLGRGDLSTEVRLRDKDDLRQVAEAVNHAVAGLRARQRERVDALEDMAVEAESLGRAGARMRARVQALLARDEAGLP